MTNALFNDNRLKLGVFGLNVSNGCAATTAEGHLQPTWQNNLDIAVMADGHSSSGSPPLSSRCLRCSFFAVRHSYYEGAGDMATINAHTSKTGQITYRVRVQKKGYPTQTATFPSLRETRRWATMIEGQIAEGRHFPQKRTHTFSELITRYIADVMPHKTSTNQRREGFILRYWDRELGHRLLSDIHPVH